MDQELVQIIRRAKQGQKEAFAQLVKRYKEAVFRHAFALLGDRMEAEDIAQEAFLKMYHFLPKLESEYAFTAWLTRMVSRLCYDQLQKRKKEHQAVNQMSGERRRESAAERNHLRLTIEEAMGKLSPEHREAIVLRDVLGYSYDEIANILNIPLGTVKSRINAARLQLRKELGHESQGGIGHDGT